MSRWPLKIVNCKLCKRTFETYLVKTGVCKLCQKKRSDKKYYTKNKVQAKCKAKLWRKNNKEQYTESNKNYYLKNKQKFKLYHKKHYQQNAAKNHIPRVTYLSSIRKALIDWKTSCGKDVKEKARILLQRAVQKGRVIKPEMCSSCNKVFPLRKIHGHHMDYNKWWDVIWLCVPCHKKEHMK